MADPAPADPQPYKVVDATGEKRFGVVASSLNDLLQRACVKLGMGGNVKVVLEADGTEVDEEEYFSTLEPNTSFMLLYLEQKWEPPGKRRSTVDDVDGSCRSSGRGLEGLLTRLQSDIGQVSLLGSCELELLSDMDPDSLTDIIPDRGLLESLKEASGRYLCDRRDAKDAMDLLRLYHMTTGGRDPPSSGSKRRTLAQ